MHEHSRHERLKRGSHRAGGVLFSNRRAARPAILCLGAAIGLACGCENPGVIADYEKRVITLQEQLRECETRRMSERERYSQTVRRVQGTKEDLQFDPAKLFTPVEIEIDPLTGGSDFDGKAGDDGITVYLRPRDRDGDVVKAAGDVRIEVLDLENPPEQQLIGRYGVSVDDLGKLWYGQLMTQHYTFECPWTKARPRHSQLTVRVTFVDYITQRSITAQAVCKVKIAD